MPSTGNAPSRADEIRVQKGASFPTRLRLGLGVVLSWIFPCFCLLEIPVQYLLEGVKVLFPERLEN